MRTRTGQLAAACSLVLATTLTFSACSPQPRPSDHAPREGSATNQSVDPESPSKTPGQGESETGDSSESGKGPQGSGDPTEQADHEAELIHTAQQLAQSYDYKAALDTIADVNSPEADAARAEITIQSTKVAPWPHPDQISHLFFHSLIIDTDRAFDGDSREQGYLDYMVTQREFAGILDQLYERGFVLINPEDFASLDANKKMAYREVMLPPGKTPLVLSVDDMSYYEYMEPDGFAKRSVITDDGKIMNEYVTPDGNTVVGAYDVQAMVDEFVAAHPDFSYRGHKGIIALTGYNGIFGYRTSDRQYGDSPTLAADKAAATKVADALKAEGWVIASHSWGHRNMTTSSLDKMTFDLDLWDKEVRPLVGKTDQFIYPFGADISGVPKYSGAKYDLMRKHGFRYFYNVDGSTTAWEQQGAGYQRQARINVDGIQFDRQLNGPRHILTSFFDVASIIDPARVAANSR